MELTWTLDICGAARAAAALMRPPVDTRLFQDALTSTLPRIAALISVLVNPGLWALIRAANPATCGAAMEVPCLNVYSSPL